MVSIVMPCYNGSAYIGKTIESIQRQTISDWELLITDDGSTDSSVEVIQKYMLSDSRISLYTSDVPSGSPSIPRNNCIEHANGEFIAFLDCDDIWLPNKLENQLKFFSDENVVIVFSDYEKMNSEGVIDHRVIKAPNKVMYRKFLKGDCIGTSTAVVRKSAINDVRFKQIGAEDYLFFIQILMQGGVAVNTQTVEVYYRQSNKSLSGNKIKSARWNWNIYKHELRFNIFKSLYYFLFYSIKGFIKFLK